MVDEVRTISLQPQYYHGWPTVTRRRNGDLALVVSGGREGHICPFGRVEMMVSRDPGARRGTGRKTILDSPSDDRDAGILETARGTLLATTFTSLAYERPPARRAEEARPAGRVAGGTTARLAASLHASQRRGTPGQPRRMDDPLDRRRPHVVGALPDDRQQSARSHPARRWPPALRRQATLDRRKAGRRVPLRR
ncbi:MAG: hypothetical protein WDN28_29090 [Chthoniobacter sp.]